MKKIKIPPKEKIILLQYLFYIELSKYMIANNAHFHVPHYPVYYIKAKSFIDSLESDLRELYCKACHKAVQTLCGFEPALTQRNLQVVYNVPESPKGLILLQFPEFNSAFRIRLGYEAPTNSIKFHHFVRPKFKVLTFNPVNFDSYSDDHVKKINNIRSFLLPLEGYSWSTIDTNLMRKTLFDIDSSYSHEMYTQCGSPSPNKVPIMMRCLFGDDDFNYADHYILTIQPHEKKLTVSSINFNGTLGLGTFPTSCAEKLIEYGRSSKEQSVDSRMTPSTTYKFDNECELQQRTYLSSKNITPGSILTEIRVTKQPAGTFEFNLSWL